MNNFFSQKKKIIILAVFLLTLLSSFFLFGYKGGDFYKEYFSNKNNQTVVEKTDYFLSPYDDIDWSKINYYSGNFHTHTSLSDGSSFPNEVVKQYYESSFNILAITDHDNLSNYKTSWPWSKISVNSLMEEKMLAVEASEISDVDNVGSFFNSYSGPAKSVEEALTKISSNNGLAIMFHPGRYTESIDFYLNLYKSFPNLVGIEVFNRNNRYPEDIKLWDLLSDKLISERFVWGFANDDMHEILSDFGFNRNIFPLEELTLEKLQIAMKNGAFFFFRPTTIGGSPSFYIKSIETSTGKITVDVSGDYQKIEWFSYDPQTEKTEVVGSGKEIIINNLPKQLNFVRFVITNNSGQLYSQPFKIIRVAN